MKVTVTSIAPCEHTGCSSNVYMVHFIGNNDRNNAILITGNQKSALRVARDHNLHEKTQ
jgi:hypothetical protein